MLQPKQLEEFQYGYGDPRPFFFKHVEGFPNTSAAMRPDKGIRFRCSAERKRRLSIPKRLPLLINKASTPFVMVPMLLTSTSICSMGVDRSKHLVFLLYNRVTKEVERIDIKRYHIEGFSPKLQIKRVQLELLGEGQPLEGAELVPELDVPLSFVKRHGFAKASDAFPVYTLAYLVVRTGNPSLKAAAARRLVAGLGKRAVAGIWGRYLAFRNSQDVKCPVGLLENPASGRCLYPLSPTLARYAIEKPPKQCRGSNVYSPLLRRCVKPERMADVDVFMEEVMGVKHRGDLKHIDGDPAVAIGVMNYILSKHPHGRFITPGPGKTMRKGDFKVIWRWSERRGSFVLGIPAVFWKAWAQHMVDASCRFIIAFVGLASRSTANTDTGHHANVLIYDKDTNELERFDGLGRHISKLYGIEGFDKEIVAEFHNRTDIFKKPVRYYTPLDYCPNAPIFQMRELNDIPGNDLRGNCAVWRAFYVHLRLANPHLNRKDLVVMASNKLSDAGSMYGFIKAYHAYLLKHAKHVK